MQEFSVQVNSYGNFLHSLRTEIHKTAFKTHVLPCPSIVWQARPGKQDIVLRQTFTSKDGLKRSLHAVCYGLPFPSVHTLHFLTMEQRVGILQIPGSENLITNDQRSVVGDGEWCIQGDAVPSFLRPRCHPFGQSPGIEGTCHKEA